MTGSWDSQQHQSTLPLMGLVLLAVWSLGMMAMPVAGLGSEPLECQDLLVNGDFEAGQVGWSQASAGGYSLISQFNPRSGQWGAYLGGTNDAHDSLSQQVLLPSEALSVTLKIWWSLATEESGGMFDVLTATLWQPGGTSLVDLFSADNDSDPDVWQEAVADLSAYAGQPVELRIVAMTDESNPTAFYLDDLTLVACAPYGTATQTPTPTHTVTPTPTLTPTPTPTLTPEPAVRLHYLPYAAVR